MATPLLPLAILLCFSLFTILPPTTAYPLHFPPSFFTSSIPIPADHIAIYNNPGTNSLAWDTTKNDYSSPPMLLCTGPDLTGSCNLFETDTPQMCLTLASPSQVGSLKVIGKASCALYNAPACTGIPTIFDPNTPCTDTRHQLSARVASLFCEPAETFTTTQNPASEPVKHVEDLRRSAPTLPNLSRRRERRNADASALTPADGPLEPYTETVQADPGPGDAKLTPWEPPAKWPPKISDGCGGDGPYYANAVGCMGPGRVRDVEAEGEGDGGGD